MCFVAVGAAACTEPGDQDASPSGTSPASASASDGTGPTSATQSDTEAETGVPDPSASDSLDTDVNTDSDPETTGSSGDSVSGSDSSGEAPTRCGAPVELGTYQPADGGARGFAADGDRVYLATVVGLDVVDIGTPDAPTRLGTLDIDDVAARVVQLDDSTVVVGRRASGLTIVDVSNPASPQAAGERADVDARGLFVADQRLYVVGSQGLVIYSVAADPSAPVWLSEVSLPGTSERVVVEGEAAFVASNGGADLLVVDVSDPADPAVSEFELTARGPHLDVQDGLLAMSGNDGVTWVDVSEETPLELGVWAQLRSGPVVFDGERMIVLGDDSTTVRVPFFSVLDVSDPSAPTVSHAAFDALDDPVWIDVVAGSVLFSTESDNALHIVDSCPLVD